MTDTIVKKYRLRDKKTKKVLEYSWTSNKEGNFCVPSTCELHKSWDGNKWLIDSPTRAEYIRNFSTEWYNADYDTPNHDLKPEELEVVEVILIEKVKPVKVAPVPTYKEFIKEMYEEENPGHYEYLLNEIRAYPHLRNECKYSWWDLIDLLDKRKRNEHRRNFKKDMQRKNNIKHN